MTKIPYNKGDAYEDKIFKILQERNLMSRGAKRAGAGNKADMSFLHNGKQFNLEVKVDLNTDFGQKKLTWSKERGWHWRKEDAITKFYTELGVIEFLKKKKLTPIRYSKDRASITQTDKRKDQQSFEDSQAVPLEALFKYYESKDCFYIQIGRGFGFYHLRKDAANLGTSQFDGKIWMRFRAKAHTTNPPYNYSFFVVLKIESKPTISKFNLDPTGSQEFPPIKPRLFTS